MIKEFKQPIRRSGQQRLTHRSRRATKTKKNKMMRAISVSGEADGARKEMISHRRRHGEDEFHGR
jgi:hypothetical protein